MEKNLAGIPQNSLGLFGMSSSSMSRFFCCFFCLGPLISSLPLHPSKPLPPPLFKDKVSELKLALKSSPHFHFPRLTLQGWASIPT